ncbi:MAG: glycine hydroxymethyltransferase [Parcubacteria group bacterium Greene0714_21]|nr:MAG: glycine hydroxymethyltransferase [Parcubacteria group bacterium Greene0416_39]TSD04158.1 MAG: glycine hydroxymethyltransferase [Parcubacteria group bacterium Greene0714_21]
MTLKDTDPQIYELIEAEKQRRKDGLEMIPSENHTSPAVLEALGSILTDKYSEGYPGKRYYGGNQYIDEVEKLAIARAKQAFGVPHVNVQPYSGSPANFAVYLATCKIGDPIMGQNLPDGGHLTHGWKANWSGLWYKSIPYHVQKDGYIDFDEVRALAREHKPKLIWCGATAYVREFPFEEFSQIAQEVGAYFAADIAHIAGLVIAQAHKSPVPFAHIVTTTTHKTLRGPRGALIMVTEKGLQKDPELAEKIDRAVFPMGVQGGPHNHQTAAIAVALQEAMQPEFKEYGHQIVKNAKVLASALIEQGLTLVSGGTDNHMMLVDLTSGGKGRGVFAQEALDLAGITLNKNTIPGDPSSPFYPSGIRLGTPAVTTRGMKEKEMKLIAEWIAQVVLEIEDYKLPDTKEERIQYLKQFRKDIAGNEVIQNIKQQITEFCKKFPIP